jgi:Glycosyl transferases group 1
MRSRPGRFPAEEGRRILTTCAWPRPQWRAQADVVAPGSPPRVITQLLARAHMYGVVVLDGSIHRDQLAALLLSRRRLPPHIVMLDATWKVGAGRLDRRAMRAAMRLLDGPHVTYCVLSRYERESFSRSWGVDHARVMFTPWPHTLTEAQLAMPVDDAEGIVALGDSLRDYHTLIEAAKQLSVPVTIATRTLSPAVLRTLPPNVTAGPVTPARFDELLRRASVVVVPLEPRTDRSAGQTTFVNAMALGKPLVVSGTAGVDDYICDGETGVLVPPRDPDALRRAIEALVHDPESARTIGKRASAEALDRFNPERYMETVLAVVDGGGG